MKLGGNQASDDIMQDQISSSPLCVCTKWRRLASMFTQTTEDMFNEGPPNTNIKCLVFNCSYYMLAKQTVESAQLTGQFK